MHPGTLPPADLWTGRWPRPSPLASPANLRLDVPCLLVCATAPGSLVICPDQPYRVTIPDRRPESAAPLNGMVKGCFDTQVPSLGGPGSFTNAPMPSWIFPAFQQHRSPCWKPRVGSFASPGLARSHWICTTSLSTIRQNTCHPHTVALAKLHVMAFQVSNTGAKRPAGPSLISGSTV